MEANQTIVSHFVFKTGHYILTRTVLSFPIVWCRKKLRIKDSEYVQEISQSQTADKPMTP